ncbi:MAG: hypothetical protein V4739_19160 [Pseudomonadota bacterium]
MLAALLVADMALLTINMVLLTTDMATEAGDEARWVWAGIVGASLVGNVLSLLFLGLVIAFMKRVRHSRMWLQVMVLVNGLGTAAGLLIQDEPFQGASLLENVELACHWSEVLVCLALGFVLHRHGTKSWFDRGVP